MNFFRTWYFLISQLVLKHEIAEKAPIFGVKISNILSAKMIIFFNDLTFFNYTAAKFSIFHVNSRKFTNFHTFSRNLFFYRYGGQTTLKIASHGLFHKKSFVLKTIHVTSSYMKNKRFFVKKSMRGYF
jgi:hypothetical protein